MTKNKTPAIDIVAEGISKHFGVGRHFGTCRTTTAAPRSFSDTAAAHMAEDDEMATAYVATRRAEAERLMSDLNWVTTHGGTQVRACIYQIIIVHEMRPRTLHATPVWGEIFFVVNGEDPVIVQSFNCMLAYILKRWW